MTESPPPSTGSTPLFVPLEETTEVVSEEKSKGSGSRNNAKVAITAILMSCILFMICDHHRAPEDRLVPPDFTDKFLGWVQTHPVKGLLAISVLMAVCVIFMVPIGTPLTMGCGIIYKGAYGWKIGLAVATAVSMGGSALGAVSCFLLGRYLMRDQVRLWIRKYPTFDAIDAAVAEHGLRIMAMLYLTPILPLGPVSYMCGTTSMALHHFVIAKVASTPLMLFYVFLGASTGALVSKKSNKEDDGLKSIEENEKLLVFLMVLSFAMVVGITRNIKKELNKILDKQKKHKPGELDDESETAALEMGTRPRQRHRIS